MPCYLPDWLRGDKWLTNFLLRFSILFSLVLYLECPPPPFPTRLPGVPGNRVPNGGTLYFTCIPGAQRGQRASNTNRHERQSNGWNIYIYIYIMIKTRPPRPSKLRPPLTGYSTFRVHLINGCISFYSCQILSPSETGFIVSAHRLTNITLLTLIATL